MSERRLLPHELSLNPLLFNFLEGMCMNGYEERESAYLYTTTNEPCRSVALPLNGPHAALNVVPSEVILATPTF